jgi:O-antigen/teichoic acid export membrane protein
MKKDIKLVSIRLIGLAIGFASQILFTKLIGIKEYGMYTLFITWTNIFSLVLVLGYDRFIIKELSYLYIEKSYSKFKYVFIKVFIAITINCFIFMIIAFCIPHKVLISTFFPKDLLRSTWIIISLGTIIFTMNQILSKVMLSIEKVEHSFLIFELILKFILFIVVILLFLNNNMFGINLIIVGALISYLIVFFITIYINRFEMVRFFKVKSEKINFSRENFLFFTINFNYYLLSQIDKIYIGKVESIEALGVYGLATTLSSLVGFSTVIYSRFLPKISYYLSNNKLERLTTEFKEVVNNALIISLPIIIYIIIFAEDIILFFGEEYIQGANIIRILLLGQVVNYFTGPNGNILINGKQKHSKIDFYNSLVVLILNIIGNILGYKLWGILGVAISTSICIAIINILKVIEIKFIYNIFPYDLQNVIIAILVFVIFRLTKMMNIHCKYLIVQLGINFTVGLLLILFVILLMNKIFNINLLKNIKIFNKK